MYLNTAAGSIHPRWEGGEVNDKLAKMLATLFLFPNEENALLSILVLLEHPLTMIR